MSKLDKELLEDLLEQFPTDKPGTAYFSALAQIKSSIKEALLSEMPKGWDREMNSNYFKGVNVGYDTALLDCLEAIKKVLK